MQRWRADVNPPVRLPAPILPLALPLLIALAAPDALAQSCGGCATPPTPGGGAQRDWLEEGAWSVRLSAEHEVRDRTFRGRDRVVNDFDETLRIERANLELRYGLTRDWTLGLVLSEMRYSYRLKPPGGRRAEFVARGPGDTILRAGRLVTPGGGEEDEGPSPEDVVDRFGEIRLGRPAAFRSRALERPSLSGWLGVSLPTGEIARPNPGIVTRDFSVSNLQTGTGTFDPLAQVRFDLPRGEWRLFAVGGASVPLYENRHRYRTGWTAVAGVGAERDIAAGLRASLTVTFQRVAGDRFRGDGVGVGGGKWIHVAPSLAWAVSDRVTVDVGVRLPAFRDADTKIVDSRAAFLLGVTVRF